MTTIKKKKSSQIKSRERKEKLKAHYRDLKSKTNSKTLLEFME
jgi:hypothetical protein